ncbi:MAG: RagB/SusD family nutrient uptake outer membrane protein [Chitinophagaceae bacterium]|nr:RagB/SusD family nutrient uptake outer membrane protein [Chitinophagaceae bacterium]
MKFNIIICIACFGLGITGCSKYLDVKPKGAIIAESLQDYEALLNDQNILNPFGINTPIIFATDDVRDLSLAPQAQTSVKGNIYFWRPYINITKDRPVMWSEMYNRIANMNLITEEVMNAKDGTKEKKKQIYAEAVVNKAWFYHHLLSFFAPAYSPVTAGQDYGVPYVTSTDQNDETPTRPSLKTSYETLVNELTAIIGDLPDQNVNNTRASKNAARGMLCRLYMSMQDYVNAEKYADQILASGASILDYNQYLSGLPSASSSTEEIFVKYDVNSTFRFSDELMARFDAAKDLRIRLQATKDASGAFYRYGRANSQNPNRGITYAEIYLNKAECLARRGEVADAMNIVNEEIRMKRFAPADYTPLDAADKEAAISAVLAERRRELAFKGLRWIDMKRLDKDGRMPPVQRFANDGTVLATLQPGSDAYTFQIPLQVQAFNPTMPLNKQ